MLRARNTVFFDNILAKILLTLGALGKIWWLILLFLSFKSFSTPCDYSKIYLKQEIEWPKSNYEKINWKKACESQRAKKFKRPIGRFIIDNNCSVHGLKRSAIGKLPRFSDFQESTVLAGGELSCLKNGTLLISNQSKEYCFSQGPMNSFFRFLKKEKIEYIFESFHNPECPKIKTKDSSIVVLIIVDGFASSYFNLLPDFQKNPVFLRGSVVLNLKPVFPSETTPSISSILTGTDPIIHGLVGSSFYSRKLSMDYDFQNKLFYKIPPIWTTLEKQGIKTAVESLPGSNFVIENRKPSLRLPYERERSLNEKKRFIQDSINSGARFVASWIHDLDEAGHRFFNKPKSIKTKLEEIDKFISELDKDLTNSSSSNIHILIASDHGMRRLDKSKQIKLNPKIFSQGLVKGSHVLAHYYNKNLNELLRAYKKLKSGHEKLEVYLKKDIPLKYNYADHSHIGDMILIAKPGWILNYGQSIKGNGVHGYLADEDQNMFGIFAAKGPKIRENFKIRSADTKEIFALMIELLGASYPKTKYTPLQGLGKVLAR